MTHPAVQRNPVNKDVPIRKADRTIPARFLDESQGRIAFARQLVSKKFRERFPNPVGNAIGRVAPGVSVFEVIGDVVVIDNTVGYGRPGEIEGNGSDDSYRNQ